MSPWKRWQDWVKVVLGAWMIVTPWIFGITGETNASWNSWILGIIFAAIGIWALASPGIKALEWVSGIAGAWVFFSPWVLSFSNLANASWNAWIVGLIAAALAVWTAAGSEKSTAAA
ncbi:MAG TPA: SPW repeat protein [Firmicutes bacterium]|nr:SPW repeat protein [Bacillota bacterium]